MKNVTLFARNNDYLNSFMNHLKFFFNKMKISKKLFFLKNQSFLFKKIINNENFL